MDIKDQKIVQLIGQLNEQQQALAMHAFSNKLRPLVEFASRAMAATSSSSSINTTTVAIVTSANAVEVKAKSVVKAANSAKATSSAKAVEGKTWVIGAAGKYCMTGNLCVGAPHTVGIMIDANNVELDMRGYTVFSPSGSPAPIGIQVNPGRSTVTIRNGGVRGFSSFGISVGPLCSNITILDVGVHKIGDSNNADPASTTAGISFVGTTNIRLEFCHVIGTISLTGNTAGILMSLCDQISVKRCKCKHIVNLGGPVSGFQCIACTNVSFTSCLAYDCETKPGTIAFPSHTVGGFYMVLCLGVTIHKCRAEKLISACDDSHGFPIFLTISTVEINCCIARNVFDGFNDITKTGAKATGFEIDGSNNVVVFNCLAERVIAYHPEDKQCAGFSSGLCTNVQFVNCISRDNKCCGGDAYGFGFAIDPRPIFTGIANETKWIKCVAHGNDIGFSLFNQTNGTMTACTSKHNRKYGVFNGGAITISCHPCTECDPPITSTLLNQSANNTVQANIICKNCTENILDLQPNSNNIYSQNQLKCC